MKTRSTLILAIALAACSSSHSSAPDAMPDAFPTAPHAPYPQMPDLGGPKLAHPQLVTVTFANDPRAAELEAYAQWIVTSNWLAAVGNEYGVGAGAVAGVAHRPETPATTITSGEIEAYLAAGVMDGSIPKPAAPATLADALYIVYYPSTTAITTTFVNGIIKHSCSDFGGYHGEVHQGSLNFAYSAIPDCGGGGAGLTANELTEEIVSHEIIEAATDAMPISAPAWQLRPDPTDAWYSAFEFEVEVGDMCEAPTRYIRENGRVAQRSWSNAAAAAGGEPCVPFDPATPAFGITATPTGTQHVAPGASIDFTITGWSTGPVADFKLVRPLIGFPMTFSAPSLNNGGTVTAHVTIPSTFTGSRGAIFLTAQHTADDATMWPLAFTIP